MKTAIRVQHTAKQSATAIQERKAESTGSLFAPPRPTTGTSNVAPVQLHALARFGPKLGKTAPHEAYSDVAEASKGSGKALPEPIQAQATQTFGQDFSNVRVHEGPEAHQVGALAYTRGENIHFQPGKYDAGSTSGQRLLGHEITHVVQQRQGRVPVPERSSTETAPINADAGLEAEADRMAENMTKTPAVMPSPNAPASTGTASAPGIQRKSAVPIQRGGGRTSLFEAVMQDKRTPMLVHGAHRLDHANQMNQERQRQQQRVRLQPPVKPQMDRMPEIKMNSPQFNQEEGGGGGGLMNALSNWWYGGSQTSQLPVGSYADVNTGKISSVNDAATVGSGGLGVAEHLTGNSKLGMVGNMMNMGANAHEIYEKGGVDQEAAVNMASTALNFMPGLGTFNMARGAYDMGMTATGNPHLTSASLANAGLNKGGEFLDAHPEMAERMGNPENWV